MSQVTIVNRSQSFAAATRDNRRALLTAAMWLQLNHIERGRVAGSPYAAAAAEGQAPGEHDGTTVRAITDDHRLVVRAANVITDTSPAHDTMLSTSNTPEPAAKLRENLHSKCLSELGRLMR